MQACLAQWVLRALGVGNPLGSRAPLRMGKSGTPRGLSAPQEGACGNPRGLSTAV